MAQLYKVENHRRSWLVLRIIFCLTIFNFFFCEVNESYAAIYYVSNCGVPGNDSNSGTSILAPWLSIQKVNATSFIPGDSVLFKRGCRWREQLIMTSTGAAGAPLSFGAYGMGDVPVISGADLGTNWTSEDIVINSSTVTAYYTTVSAEPLQVFEEDARLVSVSSTSDLALGSFTWVSSNSRLYIRTTNGSAPSAHTIEMSQRNNGILSACSNRTNTHFSDLQIEKTQSHGIYFCGSTNLVFTNVSAIRNFVEGFRFDGPTDSIVRSSMAAYNGASGLAFYQTPNLLIDQFIAHHNSQILVGDYMGGIKGHPGRNSTNVVIQNSTSYANGLGQSTTRGGGIWIDTVGSGTIIRYNDCHGNGGNGIDLDAVDNTKVYGNLSYNNNSAGIAAYADAEPSITGHKIYNNTIYGNRNYGIFLIGPYPAAGGPGSCTNNSIQNNIAAGTTNGPNFAAFFNCENPGVNGSGNIYTYNNFGPETPNFIQWGGSFGAASYVPTYQAFNAAYGSNTHSIPGNPQLTNTSASVLTLSESSPAIDSGVNLGTEYQSELEAASAWPSSIKLVSQSSYGSGWDIGAFIYTQGGALRSPTNLRVK